MLVPVAAGPAAAQSSGGLGDGVVVIANGWSPPDVGAAAPLAGRLGAAVLYATKDELGQPTVDALEELAPSRVLLMGGPAALAPGVQSQVHRVLPGATVERFSGADRIGTAARVALSAPAASRGRPVVVANGWSPPDVGAAAPLAASLGGSLLFAQRDLLGTPTVNALRRLAPSRVIIMGGTAALSVGIESQIESVVAHAPIERLAGADRVDTAARGAARADVDLGEPVVLANGWAPADVGIAAPLATAIGGNVLVTERHMLGNHAAQALAKHSPSHIILIGGSEQFAGTIEAQLQRWHPGIARINVAGADRIATASLAALFGVQFSAEQQRLDRAAASITPGEADCDLVPQLDVAGIDVVDPPADVNDLGVPVTVAEVVRIVGGCVHVDYVALSGRSVTEIRDLLDEHPDVFAVAEPLRGFEPLHDSGAHSGYGPRSGTHVNEGSGEQWHLPEDYMTKLWKEWDPDNPVSVAVIDSGVDALHPDLQGRVNTAGRSDCHVTDSWDHNPSLNNGGRLRPGGHGTHVAGIIAAGVGDGGVAGVAPDATIVPFAIWSRWSHTEVRVAADGSTTQTRHVGLRGCSRHFRGRPPSGVAPNSLHAIAQAINTGARVINMSYGAYFTVAPVADKCGPADVGFQRRHIERDTFSRLEDLLGAVDSRCNAYHQVLKLAQSITDRQGRPRGVVAVAAAGNCGRSCDATDPGTETVVGSVSNAFTLPAAYSSAIAVGAVDEQGQRARFSTARSYVEIAAPGVDIVSTVPTAKPGDGDFESWQGTSMAAPFISGVVAHMLNRFPDATPAQVRLALAESAQDQGNPGKDDEYGHGIVQPLAAIERLGKIIHGDKISESRFSHTPVRSSKITAGWRHTCGITIDESVECWGNDSYNESSPPIGRFVAVGTGDHHSCGIRNDSTIECWGKNSSNQSSPPAGRFKTIVVDDDYSCAIGIAGTVECWGRPSRRPSGAPAGIFTEFTVGDRHLCGLEENGTVKCWGSRLAIRSDTPSGQFLSIHSGDNHTCGIRNNRTLECWGHNIYGESTRPAGQFVAVTAGDHHSCAIRIDGAVECWGHNRYGQSDPPPGQFAYISGGDFHTCGIRLDGFVECWGADGYGQSTPPRTLFHSAANS